MKQPTGGPLMAAYEKSQLEVQLAESLWKLSEQKLPVTINAAMDLMPHLLRGHLSDDPRAGGVLKKVGLGSVIVLCPCMTPLIFRRCQHASCEEPLAEQTLTLCGVHRPPSIIEQLAAIDL